ncbi:hypothetical protein NQ318_007505 [Aromia moschata]|uniref:Integrase catalytic domain-containing protein n=1 Tax=Aromia moschata TaxID=1265417 RepID=A0AAV8YER4_9CUCU|nr:hypothetical protein NQ318_007505 [Aromia moschata]
MVGPHRIWALIDTGASRSFLNNKYLASPEEDADGGQVLLANGSYAATGGPYRLGLNICGYMTEANVCTMEGLSEDLILGQEWLAAQNATIDYPSRCLYFGHRPRAAVYWDPEVADRIFAIPVTLSPEEVADELRPRYERLLNEFPDLFIERLKQPTTTLVQHPRGRRAAAATAVGEVPAPTDDAAPEAVHAASSPPRRRRRGSRMLPNCFTRPSTGALNLLEDPDEPPLSLYEEVRRTQAASPEYQATRERWHRLQTGEEARRLHGGRRPGMVYEERGSRARGTPRTVAEGYPRVPRLATGRSPGKRRDTAGGPPAILLARQIRTHVRHCIICASTKRGGALQAHAPLRPRPPTRPWQALSVDVMGPFTESRTGHNRFLIVATDMFSKWVEARAVPRATGRVVRDFVNSVCLRWGYPETVISDNGPQFKCRTWNNKPSRASCP